MRIPLYIMRKNWLKNESKELGRFVETREKYQKEGRHDLVKSYERLIEIAKENIAKLESEIDKSNQ